MSISRREPPSFRPVTVRATDPLSPRMMRVTLGGPALDGFPTPEPAASVRLLLPGPDGLVVPTWNGNEFLLPDGTRPAIRTFTPRRFDPDAPSLELDIVLHGSGAASTWAEHATPGDEVAVSGPGRGYRIPSDAGSFLLLGDETAIPAICQLLDHLPDLPITVHVEIAVPEARLDLHREVDEHWHVLTEGAPPGDSLVAAAMEAPVDGDTRIWAAGEAAAMQRIRKHLFADRGLPRSAATIRGYWKRAVH